MATSGRFKKNSVCGFKEIFIFIDFKHLLVNMYLWFRAFIIKLLKINILKIFNLLKFDVGVI